MCIGYSKFRSPTLLLNLTVAGKLGCADGFEYENRFQPWPNVDGVLQY